MKSLSVITISKPGILPTTFEYRQFKAESAEQAMNDFLQAYPYYFPTLYWCEATKTLYVPMGWRGN